MSTEQKLAKLVEKFEALEAERMSSRVSQRQQTNKNPGIMRNNRQNRVQKMNEIIASFEKRAVNA